LPRVSASRNSRVASAFDFVKRSRDSAFAAFTISARWRSDSMR
jgi:hypothetical protein